MTYFKYCPMCRTALVTELTAGRNRPVCKNCGWIQYANPVPVVSCLVTNASGELLLVKRAIDPCAGRWALPGGFMELDESPEDAGKRELFEETGLEGEAADLVDVTLQESRRYGSIITIGMSYKVTVYDIIPGDDAADAVFFDVKTLPEVPFSSQQHLIERFLALDI